MVWGYMLEGIDVVGRLGRLYLPSTSANGERGRATCGWELRIKGGCILQKLKRPHPTGVCPNGLSLYSNKVDFCRTPPSPLWTLAFVFCTAAYEGVQAASEVVGTEAHLLLAPRLPVLHWMFKENIPLTDHTARATWTKRLALIT